MLCWFLPYNNVNQPLSVYIFIPSVLSLRPTTPRPTPLGCQGALS